MLHCFLLRVVADQVESRSATRVLRPCLVGSNRRGERRHVPAGVPPIVAVTQLTAGTASARVLGAFKRAAQNPPQDVSRFPRGGGIRRDDAW